MAEKVENNLPASGEKANETLAQDPTPANTEAAEDLSAGAQAELNPENQRLAELEKSVSAANERLGQLDSSLKQAVASYRAMVVKANPDVLPELISGESIADLDGSLTRARELIGKVAKSLEARKAADRVPAGAPPRGVPDTSGLSPREKISQGVERGRGRGI